MVEESRFENGKVKTRYHSYSIREIEKMSIGRLQDQIMIDRAMLKFWSGDFGVVNATLRELAMRWRNALTGEIRRLESELKSREVDR